jgi:hypothetical protein
MHDTKAPPPLPPTLAPSIPFPTITNSSELTDRILEWRRCQSAQDYKSAHSLRTLIDDFVEKSRQEAQTAESYDRTDIEYMRLRPNIKELRMAAAALVDIQKVQRMAIGLSTENVGFKMEGVDGDGNTLPKINVILHDPKKQK